MIGIRRRAAVVLAVVVSAHLMVEVVNHGDAVLNEREPLDAAALSLLAAVAGLLVVLTWPAGRRAAGRRGTRRRIRRVLRREEINIAFQPIYDLQSGGLVGAEALARFPQPRRRGPEVWFAEAHEVGLGVDLELLALRKGLSAATHLPAEIFVSINLTPLTMSHGMVWQLVHDSRVADDRVVLELTEHSRVEDYPRLLSAVRPMRQTGIGLAVDDVGAGYASMRHVIDLQPDIIKLDGSLVAGVDGDSGRQAWITTLMTFAETTGASVIAERIERPAEWETLRTLGVDAGQGWLLGHPSTRPEEWISWTRTPLRLDRG